MENLIRMPQSVVDEALSALVEGGYNISQRQWNEIVAMVHIGKISVKNAGKLIRHMMLNNGN